MKNCIMLWKNDAVDLAINNQFYVLYGVDSGIYHSGSSGLLEV